MYCWHSEADRLIDLAHALRGSKIVFCEALEGSHLATVALALKFNADIRLKFRAYFEGMDRLDIVRGLH